MSTDQFTKPNRLDQDIEYQRKLTIPNVNDDM